MQSSERIKIVQERMKAHVEDLRRSMSLKIINFNERVKKRKLCEKRNAEERKELAREWAESLKFNLDKKKRKDIYRKEEMKEKQELIEKKQKIFENKKNKIQKVKEFAKLTNSLKNYYVGEEINRMIIKKDWNSKRVLSMLDSPILTKEHVRNNSEMMQSHSSYQSTSKYKNIYRKY